MRKAFSALYPRAFAGTPIRPFATSLSKMAAAASNSTPNTLAVPVNKTAHEFDKTVLDATLYRRFFFTPAFEIYGGELSSIVFRTKAHEQVPLDCTTMARLDPPSRPTSLTHGGSTTSSRRTCLSSTRRF